MSNMKKATVACIALSCFLLFGAAAAESVDPVPVPEEELSGPAANSGEVLEIFDEDTPLASSSAHKMGETVDQADGSRYIEIFADWGDKVLEGGDRVALRAVLHGYEGMKVAVRWQFKTGPDEIWQDVKDGEGDRYQFIFDVGNWQYTWRAVVEILDVAQ